MYLGRIIFFYAGLNAIVISIAQLVKIMPTNPLWLLSDGLLLILIAAIISLFEKD